MSPWLFQFTNLVFISAIQNVLLLLLGLPAKTAALQVDTSLATSDYALAALALTLLLFEFTADNQQYAYHAYKHSYLARERDDTTAPYYNQTEHWVGSKLTWRLEDAQRGFITRGLWAYSRHPNFFCEQSFWVRSLLYCRQLVPVANLGVFFPLVGDHPIPSACSKRAQLAFQG